MQQEKKTITKPVSQKVGVTGGIGSGKTTVCQIFESLGIPVYYADQRAKALMTDDPKVRAAVTQLFGKEAYLPDGQLNRALLASVVFQDKTMLEKLNAIVHPAVHQDTEEWHLAQSNVPYTIREAALLVENGSYRQLDKLIVVAAPAELRIMRVMERDQSDEVSVRARIDAQLPEAEKIAVADFVINNDGHHSLVEQVIQIHRELLAE